MLNHLHFHLNTFLLKAKMIQTKVMVSGVEEFRNFIIRLPKNIRKDTKRAINLKIAKSLQRRIKRRAPVFTGFLKQSIVRTGGRIMVQAPYAALVEFGFRAHYFPSEFIDLHRRQPGATVGLKWSDIYGGYPRSPKALAVWNRRPFVRPAIKATRKDIGKIMKNTIKKSVKRSWRK